VTLAELADRLNGVRWRGDDRIIARCPAHDDRSPSLSARAGDRGLLLRCWAGCRLDEIAAAVGVTVGALFYDAPPRDSRARAAAIRAREAARARREAQRHAEGCTIDLRRAAERVIAAARNPGLVGWTDDDVDRALHVVADAYNILDEEATDHGHDGVLRGGGGVPPLAGAGAGGPRGAGRSGR
jgi:hypothetical protein